MATVRTPKTVGAATKLLERYAELAGEIAKIEEQRKAELAEVNAEADRLIAPFLPEYESIDEKLTAWWPTAAAELTKGERKSVTLGGCEIGSRLSPATLGVDGDELLIAKALFKQKWSRDLVRVSMGIDRSAVLKSIDGAHAEDLAALGLSRVDGTETVFVRRVKQGGTRGATKAG